MMITLRLSQMWEHELNSRPMLFRRCINHTSFVVVEAKARYSASAVERDTIACFLAPQDNKLSPI